MARTLIPTNTLVGRNVISSVQQIIAVRDQLIRTKAIMDQITTNGTVLTALDSSAEALNGKNAAGDGAVMYAAVTDVINKLTSTTVSAFVSGFDQG